MSCSRTQRSDVGEAHTHKPSVSSQALYHRATALSNRIVNQSRLDYLIFAMQHEVTKMIIETA